MKRLTPTGRASLVGIAIVAAVCSLSAPPASAAWQTVANAPTIALNTATLGAPATTCTSMPAPTLGVPYARISWATVTPATGYRVQFGSSPTAYRDTTATSYDVTGTLLVTLLGSVLSGGSTTVTVTARYQNWVSLPSNAQTIVLSDPVTGLLGGVKCK